LRTTFSAAQDREEAGTQQHNHITVAVGHGGVGRRRRKPEVDQTMSDLKSMTADCPLDKPEAAGTVGESSARRLRPPSSLYYYDIDYAASAHVTTVPLPVCFVVLAAYVLGGAAIFGQLYGRKSRDWLTWSAGTFSSLAALLTIGGWYPTASRSAVSVSGLSWPPDPRFVYVVWLIVGLLLVATCCTLVRERLSHVTCSCCTCCDNSNTD
jgi:hypothetical protein